MKDEVTEYVDWCIEDNAADTDKVTSCGNKGCAFNKGTCTASDSYCFGYIEVITND